VEEKDLVGADLLDRVEHAVRRRRDPQRVHFVELPRRHDLVEPRRDRHGSRLGRRK
jgi:hypothetical protein